MATKDATINILLADDDADERLFFEIAVTGLSIATNFKTVADGVFLMDFLNGHLDSLPDVLFLDINMPRKNGNECLNEIKNSGTLRHLPVIIYSTAGSDKEIEIYFQNGANNFLQKGNFAELAPYIEKAVGLSTGRSVCKPMYSA